MRVLAGPTPAPRAAFVLDADGLAKLARHDRRAREMARQAYVEEGASPVLPLIVVVQVLAGGTGRGAVDDIIATIIDRAGIDVDRAAEAAGLLQVTGTTDVVDALVAVEALRRVPSIVLTSDPDDLRALLDASPAGSRVEVWRV